MSVWVSVRRRFRAWLRRHSYSFFSSLGALLTHRVGTLMTVLVLAIGMLLPLGLWLGLHNLDRLDIRHEDWGSISVFMKAGSEPAEAESLSEVLRQRPDVATVQAISPEQGMAEFIESSGFGPSAELLGENPLPWVLVVSPSVAAERSKALDRVVSALAEEIEPMDGVAFVQFDHKWLQRLQSLLDLGRAAVLVLALVFGVAVIVVVANTIRLDVAARSEEIEILALVGAGNAFIRQPFLYSGLWYGLMGGLLAAGLAELCLAYLSGPFGRLLEAYGQSYRLEGLSPGLLAGLLAASTGLGLLGAWLAVQRYLGLLAVGGSLGRR
ncbi:MAG: permease-like cell division protein FtsX [Xanthomonadales bacterium]|nr:permease-like cell division protein FtsX [Xanthomonadales bacterium]